MGSKERGRKELNRHTLPQAAPKAAEMTAVLERIFVQRAFVARMGWVRKLLNFTRARTKYTFVRKRARRGMERRFWWREAVRQEGDLGWRRAQDREAMDGWAGEVMADMDWRESGMILGFEGWRIGEIKALS